jgi:hypothetical protein
VLGVQDAIRKSVPVAVALHEVVPARDEAPQPARGRLPISFVRFAKTMRVSHNDVARLTDWFGQQILDP